MRATERGARPAGHQRERTNASRSRRVEALDRLPALVGERRQRREIARVALDGVRRHAPHVAQVDEIECR